MQIRITDGLLHFDQETIRYNRYISSEDVIQMLKEWIPRLSEERLCRQAVYLPFSLDEEYLEAFEVEPRREQVVLTVVKLDAIGYVPGVDSLLEEIKRQDRPVVKRRDKPFLVCDKDQLIEAVKEVIARTG